jgi:hypothetical protein
MHRLLVQLNTLDTNKNYIVSAYTMIIVSIYAPSPTLKEQWHESFRFFTLADLGREFLNYSAPDCNAAVPGLDPHTLYAKGNS